MLYHSLDVSLATGVISSCMSHKIPNKFFRVVPPRFDCGQLLLCVNPEKAEAARSERYRELLAR